MPRPTEPKKGSTRRSKEDPTTVTAARLDDNAGSVQDIPPPRPHMISAPLVVISLVSCMWLAFSLGRTVRTRFLTTTMTRPSMASGAGWVHHCGTPENPLERCAKKTLEFYQDYFDEEDEEEDEEDEDDEEDDEEMVGAKDFILSFERVDPSHLSSQEWLVETLQYMLNELDLVLLSHYCHTVPDKSGGGIHCLAVLLDGHASIETMPALGRMDVSCLTQRTSTDFLSVLPKMQERLDIPSSDFQRMRWEVSSRGGAPVTDMELRVLAAGNTVDYKQQIATAQTPFQRIDIFDVILTGDSYRVGTLHQYQRSLTNDGSYESRHPEYFQPDRIVFLDGVAQSTRCGDEGYHEPLVQPALLAHPHPKRAAIIGGGEGATLREVLKHNTIEEAIMIDIDEIMVNVSRTYLPSWSDCSDLVGSAEWCGDDPRASMYYEDAIAWFIDRYAEGPDPDRMIDVIIMDALDPESEIPFAEALYRDPVLVGALYNALSSDGILMMQLGEAPSTDDPPEQISKYKNREAIRELLEQVGFESMHMFEGAHGGFGGMWSYMVAFKDYNTRTGWFANEAQVNLAIQKRMVRTKSGRVPLRYFDGSTMAQFQVPTRNWQIPYCRKEPMPEECNNIGFKQDRHLVPASSLYVKATLAGNHSLPGLFTAVDIPKNSYLALDEAVHPVHFRPSTVEIVESLLTTFAANMSLDVVSRYTSGYGMPKQIHGTKEVMADSSVLSFLLSARNNSGLFEVSVGAPRRSIFSPVLDRQLYTTQLGSGVAVLQDIRAGEQILDIHLNYVQEGSEKRGLAEGAGAVEVDMQGDCLLTSFNLE